MAWITSDKRVAASLRENTGEPVEVRGGDALDAALATRTDTIVLLPGSKGSTNVAVIHWNEHPSAPQEIVAPAPEEHAVQTPATEAPRSQPEPRHEVVATGLLGLTDAIEYEDEPQKPKKWWQKLLD